MNTFTIFGITPMPPILKMHVYFINQIKVLYLKIHSNLYPLSTYWQMCEQILMSHKNLDISLNSSQPFQSQ